MLTDKELQSKTIALLRFPLIVGVVLIHTYFKKVSIGGVDLMAGADFPIYENFAYYLSQIVARTAVPLFFFFSGYLFFCKPASFSMSVYKDKLRKRARTILLPYIIWNILVLLFFYLANVFVPGLMSGANKLIADYTFSDFMWAFWDTTMINPKEGPDVNHHPICYQFWFIRDLLIVMLFSPILYVLIRRLRHYLITLLGILWYFNWWFSIPGFSISAFFFFSFGAYFAIEKRNFVADFRRLFPYSFYVYLLISLNALIFKDYAWCSYVNMASIPIGIVAIISLVAHFIRRGTWSETPFLSASSFFIYAYHAMPLAFIVKLSFKVLQPSTDLMVLFLFCFCSTITILIGLVLYFFLRKWFPRLTAIITGGR